MNRLQKRQEQKGKRIFLFSVGALRNTFNLIILCFFFLTTAKKYILKNAEFPLIFTGNYVMFEKVDSGNVVGFFFQNPAKFRQRYTVSPTSVTVNTI